MRFESARFDGEALVLNTGDTAALRFVYGFKPGEYDILPAKKRRSLDANAYAWVLIDKLAYALNLPKGEVYREAIRGIGGVSETVCVPSEGAQKLVRLWGHNGLGWIADCLPSKIPGCTNVVLYYGSSVYDAKQMSRLIDALIADCKQLGIETMPPDKLAAMLEGWDAAQNKSS